MRLSTKHYAQILDKALAEADSDHTRGQVIKDFARVMNQDGKTAKIGEVFNTWKKLYNKRHGINNPRSKNGTPSLKKVYITGWASFIDSQKSVSMYA